MILSYKEFIFESSSLLNLKDNVDQGMIRTIKSLINPPSKILEISCGNAMDSIHLQGLGYDIKCTELDPKYVKNAQDLGLDCIQHNTQDRFHLKMENSILCIVD